MFSCALLNFFNSLHNLLYDVLYDDVMLACMDPSKNKGHQFVTTALGKVASLLQVICRLFITPQVEHMSDMWCHGLAGSLQIFHNGQYS